MCGRYFLANENAPSALRQILERIAERPGQPPLPTGEIFPSMLAPVIAHNKRLEPTPFAMKWGYSANGKLVINARSETAARAPLFRDGMAQRRCLVPASYYYEWRRVDKQKVKYRIDTGEKLLFMAGLYRLEQGQPVFTILTCEPAEQLAFIHNRMPVILPGALCEAWLDAEADPEQVLRQAVEARKGFAVPCEPDETPHP